MTHKNPIFICIFVLIVAVMGCFLYFAYKMEYAEKETVSNKVVVTATSITTTSTQPNIITTPPSTTVVPVTTVPNIATVRPTDIYYHVYQNRNKTKDEGPNFVLKTTLPSTFNSPTRKTSTKRIWWRNRKSNRLKNKKTTQKPTTMRYNDHEYYTNNPHRKQDDDYGSINIPTTYSYEDVYYSGAEEETEKNHPTRSSPPKHYHTRDSHDSVRSRYNY